MKREIVLFAIGVIFTASQAMAYTINVDFAPNLDVTPPNAGSDIYSVDYVGTAAAPDTGTTWNILDAGNDTGNGYNFEDTNIGVYDQVDATASYAGLVDSTGNATSVGVVVGAGGSFAVSDNAGNLNNIASDAQGLMRDYLIAFNSGATVNISGLAPGQEVVLYLYGEGDNTSNDRATFFDANGTTGGTVGDAGPAVLTAGSDYVVLSGVFADASGDIAINYSPFNAAEGPFNGFQLTTVPEPSALVLVGLASMGLASLRRKK